MDAKKATEMGMVDIVVEGGREELEKRAMIVAKEWAAAPHMGRLQTKLWLRKEFGEAWESYRYEECDSAWNDLNRKETIEILGGVRRRLSDRSAKM